MVSFHFIPGFLPVSVGMTTEPIHLTDGRCVSGAESFCLGEMVHSLLPAIVSSHCLSDGGHIVFIS